MGEPAGTPSSRFAPSLTQDAGSEKTLEILGSLPDCDGPPNARITPAAGRGARLIISATFSLLPKLQSSAARASSFLVKLGVAQPVAWGRVGHRVSLFL